MTLRARKCCKPSGGCYEKRMADEASRRDCTAFAWKDARQAKNKGTPRPYLRNVNVRWFSFKAWCTRRLKERERSLGKIQVRQNWWTQCGSKRWLNDAQSLEEAIRYVAEGQGEPTPETEHKPEAQAKDI